MSERAPTLSVTVTNFNYCRYLEKNLRSILAQTYEDYELVVIDNASTDGSLELLEDFARQDERIRLVVKDRTQPAIESFREACSVARGRYRIQIDADDWVLVPHAFARQVTMLEAHDDMTFVYSPMATYGQDGETYVHRFYDGDQVMSGVDAVSTVLRLSLGHSGMMLRLEAYRACGGYPAGYRFYDDVLLAARLCELGSVGYVDEQLYCSRQHGGNENRLVDIDVIESEVLAIIDEILDGPLGAQMSDRTSIRRRLRKAALTHQAMLHAFADRPATAWKLYLNSLRRHPVETLLQTQTLSIVVRTSLGHKTFERLRAGVQAVRAGRP